MDADGAITEEHNLGGVEKDGECFDATGTGELNVFLAVRLFFLG